MLNVTTETLVRNLERCLWHVETPLANLAPVGKYLLSDLAQRHVKVVLTGEGALAETDLGAPPSSLPRRRADRAESDARRDGEARRPLLAASRNTE